MNISNLEIKKGENIIEQSSKSGKYVEKEGDAVKLFPFEKTTEARTNKAVVYRTELVVENHLEIMS